MRSSNVKSILSRMTRVSLIVSSMSSTRLSPQDLNILNRIIYLCQQDQEVAIEGAPYL